MIKHLPNILTLIRLIMALVFLAMILYSPQVTEAGRWLFLDAAFVIFVVAGLTDIADGKIARKYNENQIIQNSIAAHHSNVEPNSPISIIIQIANELSKKRPGARREAIEGFINRMRQMEAIAGSFDGVYRSFAIQAGKEIRVIVSHEKVDDTQIHHLAKEIAKKIEEEIEYPGQIKVVVIREFRGIDYA